MARVVMAISASRSGTTVLPGHLSEDLLVHATEELHSYNLVDPRAEGRAAVRSRLF